MTRQLPRMGAVYPTSSPSRLSIELTNQCSKACDFCYNGSRRQGETVWTLDELLQLIRDVVRHGVQAISLGGGEPLEFDGLFPLLRQTHGLVFRSLTTNGLLLDDQLEQLRAAAPDKVHVSLHYPGRRSELERVIRQVQSLGDVGIEAGVNLLIRRSGLEVARHARARLHDAGIPAERITHLPMRGEDEPSPREVASVAGAQPFASMTCLLQCASSPRFAAIDWKKRVAWCSYTPSRRPLESLDHRGLMRALDGLALQRCGPESLGPPRLSTLRRAPALEEPPI